MAYDIAKRYRNNGSVAVIDNITYAGYRKLIGNYKITINLYKGHVNCISDKDVVVIDLHYWNKIETQYN